MHSLSKIEDLIFAKAQGAPSVVLWSFHVPCLTRRSEVAHRSTLLRLGFSFLEIEPLSVKDVVKAAAFHSGQEWRVSIALGGAVGYQFHGRQLRPKDATC